MMALFLQKAATVMRTVNGSRQKSMISWNVAQMGVGDNPQQQQQQQSLQWLCSFCQKDLKEIMGRQTFATCSAATLILKKKLLQSVGLSAEDLWSVPTIHLCSQAHLQKGIKELDEQGVRDVSTSSIKKRMMRSRSDDLKVQEEQHIRWLCNFFQKDEKEILDKLSQDVMQKAKTLVPKLDFLRSVGYAADDLWPHTKVIVRRSLAGLQKAVKEVEAAVGDGSVTADVNKIPLLIKHIRGTAIKVMEKKQHVQWLSSFFQKDQEEIKSNTSISQQVFEKLKLKIEYLEEVGYFAEELWLHSEVMTYSLRDIKIFATALKEHGLDKAGDVHQFISKQLRADDVSWLCNFFGKDEDEITSHRFITRKLNLEIVKPRIELLMEHGISADDLWSGAFILDYPKSELARVVGELKAEHVGKITARMVRCKLCEHKSDEQVKWLCDFFQKTPSDLESKKELVMRELSFLKSKLEYLVSIGYTPKDLWSSVYLVRCSLARLKKAVKELESYGIEVSKSPFTLFNYAFKGILVRKQGVTSRQVILRLLQFDEAAVANVGSALTYLSFQHRAVLEKNIEFLLGHGFTLEHLRQCPFIVGHNHSVLRSHYLLVRSSPEFEPFPEWESDRVKLLNLCQYSIEKQYSFLWPVILHEGEMDQDGGRYGD